MPILNYTTIIPVRESMGLVIGKLADAGARRITTLYDATRTPVGIEFSITTGKGDAYFRLPVDVDAVHKILLADPKIQKQAYMTREHAAKVAWRIIKDWTEAQLALIEASMVRLDEVMFPYQLAGNNGETIFQLWDGHRLALEEPKK